MATATKSINWPRTALVAGGAVVLLAGLVVLARVLRDQPAVQDFLVRYPGVGTMPASTPVGTPGWLGWQHFLNMFFMVMIIRTGWLIRLVQRPKAFWTRNNEKFIRTKGEPTKISFNLWMHLSFDFLWLLNGLIFVVALIVSGQWMKVVPTNWDVIPNAVSVGLQYLSLDWPTENGWIHYNALQLLFYFVTIFIAAPLAALTGFRQSPAWSKRWTKASRLIPIEPSRAVHFITMGYFVVFIGTHLTLVMATGALRNLNHIYAATDSTGWAGFWLFLGSLVVVAIGWVLARVLFLQPVASLTGKVTAR